MYMKTRMKSDRHTDVKEHFLGCFLVDLWPWPSNHYSCCVILKCNNKYKLLLSLPQNSGSLHCHTTKSCRETTKSHIPGIKSSNDNSYSSTLCRDCRERTLLGFLRHYEILSFQTKFQKKACKEAYTKATKELSAIFQHHSKLERLKLEVRLQPRNKKLRKAWNPINCKP